MIRHPLIELVNYCDDRLNDLIEKQKALHQAFVLGLLNDEQKLSVIELDDKITEIVREREKIQKRLFEETHLVILHDWEWDL